MERINTHFNNGIILPNKLGYAKIATINFGASTTISGVPSYASCSFNLDITSCGSLYYTGKPFSGRFFIYIQGQDANPTKIDLYYDNKDLLNIQNNTSYDMSNDTIQFVANYNILDSSADRPVANYNIDIYLKSDSVIAPAFNVNNFTSTGGVSFENNLLVCRDIVTSIPTGNANITYNQYNKINYRKIFQNQTTGTGFTSTELVKVTDPIARICSYYGRITLNGGFVLNDTLDYVSALSSKYSPLTEIHFPVIVYYNITGNPIGTGDVKVTTGSTLKFVGYDRMDTQPITTISSISLTGVSWEY